MEYSIADICDLEEVTLRKEIKRIRDKLQSGYGTQRDAFYLQRLNEALISIEISRGI